MFAFGIDGGGTRSTLVALDERGEVRLRLEGGPLLVDPSNPGARAIPIEALARAGAERLEVPLPLEALCCAIAGAGRPQARSALTAALEATGAAQRVQVVTDAEAAFHDAFGASVGVLVIAGTGSVVRARDTSGVLRRVGGWGQLLGDEGSGYAIGVAVLRAVVHAVDGRSADTSLIAPVLARTGCSSPDQLIPWAAHAGKAGIAALAQLAFDTPGSAARDIVAGAAVELAEQVIAVLASSNGWPRPLPLACAGGLIGPGRPLRDPLLRTLHAEGLHFDVLEEPVDGARGAAGLALRLAMEDAPAA
jgi:N-acetylglucosamine kinase-like BadF-type ATPase